MLGIATVSWRRDIGAASECSNRRKGHSARNRIVRPCWQPARESCSGLYDRGRQSQRRGTYRVLNLGCVRIAASKSPVEFIKDSTVRDLFSVCVRTQD
jgi:hypothetical protein